MASSDHSAKSLILKIKEQIACKRLVLGQNGEDRK